MRTFGNVARVVSGAVLLLAAESTCAQFINVQIVDVTTDVGTPDGFETFRVVANFAGPDVVHAWGSPLDFYTGNGVDLLNAGGKFSGLKEEDFPAFPITEAYDSWVSLTSIIDNVDDGGYDDGFLGSDGIHAVIIGSSFHEDDGLVRSADPDAPVLGPEVFLAQFTIPVSNGFHLEGMIAWGDDGQGGVIETAFMVDNIIPAPGALALLGLAGLISARRRRAFV